MNKEEATRLLMLAAEVRTTKEDLRLEQVERYSNRLKGKMDLSGYWGSGVCGDLTPFVPWLLAAQILHIGRNTTFGMGRIEVYLFEKSIKNTLGGTDETRRTNRKAKRII